MAGSCNGGGTVIGPGRSWSDSLNLPSPEGFESNPECPITQRDLMIALGISRRSRTGKNLQRTLRQLIAQNILLENGDPNPSHPKVRTVVSKHPQP